MVAGTGRNGRSTSPAALVPDPTTSLQAYLAALQSALVSATRMASSLPGPSDLSFHRSIDKQTSQGADEASHQVAALLTSIQAWVAKAQANDKNNDEAGEASDTRFEKIAELVDGLLERADVCLDEYSGKRLPKDRRLEMPPNGRSSQTATPSSSTAQAIPRMGKLPPEILNAQIQPPQRNFTLKPDNRADDVWDRPLTLGKPNALVPISWQPPPPAAGEPLFEPGTVRQGMYCAEGDPRHNPYYHEIFQAKPPVFVYQPPSQDELQPPPPLLAEVPQGVSGVPFTWIDTAEGVQALVEHLEEDRVKEIAIDLEAHAYRSYQGIACLMQLSTRWGDYILDLLADPVRLNTERLNTSFTDPNKVKILHGAEHDVLWLQRDCGLYLVNLFDTYHATNVLSFPAHSLAYLLSKYYDFEADKRYQLADWRIRPLPKEMMYYARSDTHSLIYVYNRLRAEILTTGGKPAMEEVFKRSQITAARRYAKEVWDDSGNSRDGWRSMWRRMGGEEARGTDLRMEISQMGRTERLVRRLHLWRDQVAREEDESPRYILSAQNLLNLASRAPMVKSEVLVFFTPGIAPVRKRAAEVARIIKEEVLAWEQDRMADQLQRKAELENLPLVGASEALGERIDEEDLGTLTTQRPSEVEASEKVSGAEASTSQLVWSSGGTEARPIVRSSRSSLFGSVQTDAHVPGLSQQTQSTVQPDSLQTSLVCALQTVIGSISSLLGGGHSDSLNGPTQDQGVAVAQGVELSGNGLWAEMQKRSGDVGAASTDSVAQSTSAVVSEPEPEPAGDCSSPPSSQSASDEGESGIVRVKKQGKAGWSNAQKRKARQERVLQMEGERAKKAKVKVSPSTRPEVKSFDYSTTPSILDASPTAQHASAGQRKIRKGKRERGQLAEKPKGPERFADLPQPKDRTGLSGAGRSATFR